MSPALSWRVAACGSVLFVASCGHDVGIQAIDSGAFVYPTRPPTADTDLDADAGAQQGCSVAADGDPDPCVTDESCCDVSGERCVPAVDGVGICRPAGPGRAGERCGRLGVDDCGRGMLCTSLTTRSTDLACRPICRSDSDCRSGPCEVELDLGAETVRICR